MKIYTKGGDKGTTSLVGGSRVSKGDLRIDLYGDVDELNAFLGHCMVMQELFADRDYKLLQLLQYTLFDLGALMACEVDKRKQFKLSEIKMTVIEQMEQAIDEIETDVGPLKKFIMPMGSELITRLHLARVVARRVERKLVAFETSFPDEIISNANILLNRLSDYLFILVRYQIKKENISLAEYR